MPNPSELQRQRELEVNALRHFPCSGKPPKRKCFVDFDAYTPDEIEFMNAMREFKERTRKLNPDCRDILAVLRSLGYRRVVS